MIWGSGGAAEENAMKKLSQTAPSGRRRKPRISTSLFPSRTANYLSWQTGRLKTQGLRGVLVESTGP